MWIKTKSTFTFTCSQTQSEKKAVLSKARATFNTLVNWQIILCLSPLPTPSSTVSTQIRLDSTGEFQFYWKQWQNSHFIQWKHILLTCCSSLLSKELPFPSNFMLGSIKSKHLFQARDAKNSAFCWADPLSSISSLPKWENITPYVTVQYVTLTDTLLIFEGVVVGWCLFFCYRGKLQWGKWPQEFTVYVFYIVRRTHSFPEKGPKFFISKIPFFLTFTPVKEFRLMSLILGNQDSHEWHFSLKQPYMKKSIC